jgi:hypothetical protein
MNTIEERLWSYIDGTCTEEEHKAIDMLITNDEAYRSKFEELLSLDQQLAKMEADEPSMGFTYKVMESIRTEYAQQPLKAAINKRIIKGIGGFFILTILLLLIFVLSTMHLTPVSFSVHLPDSLKVPDIKSLLSSPVVKGFFFFDVVLLLFLLDSLLRRKSLSKQV